MDTVDAVLLLLLVLTTLVIALACLAFRLWYALRLSQAENLRLVAQSRPRPPQHQPYETGLKDHGAPYVDILA